MVCTQDATAKSADGIEETERGNRRYDLHQWDETLISEREEGSQKAGELIFT